METRDSSRLVGRHRIVKFNFSTWININIILNTHHSTLNNQGCFDHLLDCINGYSNKASYILAFVVLLQVSAYIVVSCLSWPSWYPPGGWNPRQLLPLQEAGQAGTLRWYFLTEDQREAGREAEWEFVRTNLRLQTGISNFNIFQSVWSPQASKWHSCCYQFNMFL